VRAASTTNILRGGITISELFIDSSGVSHFDTDGSGIGDGPDIVVSEIT
jgi:hypothetical protein